MSQGLDGMDADKARKLYRLVSIGMTPEDVRISAGEPERKFIGRERICWTYQGGRIVVVFSVDRGRTAVSKVIFRSSPRFDGSAN